MNGAVGGEGEAILPTGESGKIDWRHHFSTRWLAMAGRLEAQLAPVDPVLFSAALPRRGDVVLDVGCGRGPSTVTAAAFVGAEGQVCGVDMAGPLIDAARSLHEQAPGAPIDWLVADAGSHAFEAERFDLVISRFGTLFFEDPLEAFANLRRATKDGGRLAIAVWLPADGSELFARPSSVALSALRALGYEPEVMAPDAGPFRFGVEATMLDVLSRSGWRNGRFDRFDLAFYLGGPGATPDEAAAVAATVGPVARLVIDVPTEVAEHVAGAVASDLATCGNGNGIPLVGRIAIAQATA